MSAGPLSGSARRTFRHRKFWAAITVVVATTVLVAAGRARTNVPFPLRVDEPVVLTGTSLSTLVGADPQRVVAFRVDETGNWQSVPVQVDERKLIDFGTEPVGLSPPAIDGTVYGTPPVGLSALQYTDSSTFVGGDTQPLLDADDEVVFMASDAGATAPANLAEPPGAVLGSGVQVQLADAIDGSSGAVYLFRGMPGLDPAAGRNYVTYAFNLLSGKYKTTYQRVAGGNPEDSVALTPSYEARFTDRWLDADWRLVEGDGRDILDGYKFQISFDTCSRSNATFAAAEGAFATNLDGPVRGIRSYIGANSGTYMQRTNYFYRERQEIVTDFRVHPVDGIVDYIDLSGEAIGMTYRSSQLDHDVIVDGQPDAVSTIPPSFEWLTGAQGTLLLSTDVQTSLVSDPRGFAQQFFIDALRPPQLQCWGDRDLIGASGWSSNGSVPNTDPVRGPAETLQIRRVFTADEPGISPAEAAAWGTRVNRPLIPTVTPFGRS